MSYIVGQYNHTSASADDSSFITPIISGIADRRQNNGDSESSNLNLFTDECVRGLNLVASKYYYFRCQIKRMIDEQRFTIKLVNFNETSTGSVEQFIKTIVIQGGEREEWVNVEFIFHPVIAFDTILFQLQRNITDYRDMIRYPKICYQQLGSINNIITTKVKDGATLLKIGVQSHPGLSMCVNGEEIRISRTGIFELRNGVLPINFFSVTNPASEDTATVVDWEMEINQLIENIENDPTLSPVEKEARYRAITSECFFGTSKTYTIDAFTLDYMYED